MKYEITFKNKYDGLLENIIVRDYNMPTKVSDLSNGPYIIIKVEIHLPEDD